MAEAFYYVQLIIEHVQTTGKVTVWGEKSVFSQLVQIINFYGIILSIFCGSQYLSKSSSAKLFLHFIIIDNQISILIFRLFNVEIILNQYW